MTTNDQTTTEASSPTPLRAEPRDDAPPPGTHTTKNNRTGVILGVIGLALVGGAIGWGFFQDEPFGSDANDVGTVIPASAPEIMQPIAVIEPASKTTAEPQAVADEPEIIPPEPALALEDSDPVIREASNTINGGEIVKQFTAADFIIERAVAVLDNLQLGQVPYKLLPIARPTQKFQVIETDQGFIAAPVNTSRYDGLAKWINAINIQTLVALIDQFRPAAQEAYALLGYPAEDFDTALKLAITQIATTPEPYPEAILSVKESVYIYVDESLEALPALQKQIMRMGDENMAILRSKALALQSELEKND